MAITSPVVSLWNGLIKIRDNVRFVLTVVKQLDRAAHELETDHPINNRMALILIDNAAELLIHRQCVGHLETDNEYSRLWKAHESIAARNPNADQTEILEELRASLLTTNQRKGASGIRFGPKLKVLYQTDELKSTERQFIKIAHGYRNQLYHVGLTHDDVIRAIAGQYFLLTCNLFVRLEGAGFFGHTFSSIDEYSEVAKRYLPMRDGHVDTFGFDKKIVAEKLRRALPSDIADLSKTLGYSARTAVEEVRDELEFLVINNPFGFDSEKMIEVAQWQKDLSDELEKQGIDGLWIDPGYRESLEQVEASLALKWKQRHRSLPVEKWLDRADGIQREHDPLVALEKYQSLRNDMNYLERAIRTAAEELDEAIQAEIDRRRGK